MPSFKHLALAALLALSGTSATGTVRGWSNAGNERLDALEDVQMSVDAVSQFLHNLEVNDESFEKVEGIAQVMNEMGPKFTEMRDAMFEDSADAEEWSVYSSTLDKFSSVMDILKEKLEESASFIDSEGESPSESSDESSDESVDEVDSQGLVEALNFAKMAIEEASDENSLNEAEKALNYVSTHMNGLEGEIKSRFEEASKLLGEKLDEKRSSFEEVVESEDKSADEKVPGEGLVEVLKFAKSAIDNASNLNELDEARDALDYVRNNLNGLESEVKSKFGEATELLFDRLDEKRPSFEEVVESQDAHDKVSSEDLLESLQYANSMFNDEMGRDELLEVEDVLKFVGNNLDGLEGNVKIKMEKVTELLSEKLSERKSAFEEKKVAGLMSKLGFSEGTIEDYMNEEEEEH
eukprot:CAMPEP_0172492744 /NCGR_PEP_ID=MMETSP1066-20121228/23986_1 /TAXON_ID=671091 /ORGANISM="Coscinodiscus wailesii, Strain CCMP2513" /LENGTH=408 /DNA_ID=CAMNT_0013262539 /DNA_START=83 /DNA_END=1309 /DNA_ORIENTATION=+